METVTKVCLKFSSDEIFVSLFPQPNGATYRMNEKSLPQVGFFYAFFNKIQALKWIHESIEGNGFNEVMEQIASNGAKLCLLQGETTRIACKFARSIRHIDYEQLKTSEMSKAFWTTGKNEFYKQLIIRQDPEGSILIPDFTPRSVSFVVQ